MCDVLDLTTRYRLCWRLRFKCCANSCICLL